MNEANLLDPDFLLYLYGPEGSVEPRFTDEVMAGLAADFEIPDEAVAHAQVGLEYACRAYWTQAQRPEIRSEDVRRELAALSKAAADLQNRISAMAPETWDTLLESGRRQKLDTPPTPRISEVEDVNSAGKLTQLCFRQQTSGTEETCIEFSKWFDGIEAFRVCVDLAAELAGAGKPGQQADHAAFLLLAGAYGVWRKVLKRDFRILWNETGDWLTQASRFCLNVAFIVDPQIEPSRVRNAVRSFQKEIKQKQ
jgi:hypothetical protein